MKIKKQFRDIAPDSIQVDKEKRTIEFPFSSEYPVERWFGTEILSHDRSAMDLKRLNDGGALLWNHRMDEVIGVIESAELRSDKRLWCKARFSQEEKGAKILREIEDGILRNVSFGYQVEEFKLTKSGKDSPDEYTATKWMPFEVSIVSIPADPTVGIGRADSDDAIEVRVINPNKGEEKMKPETQVETVDAVRVAADAVAAERTRANAITAMCEKHGMAELGRELVSGGKTLEQAREAVLERIGQVQKPVSQSAGDVGLSKREVKQFSFLRAMALLANPHDARVREAAKFELECSAAAEKIASKPSRGVMVPAEVLRAGLAQRDLTVGTAADGGNLVATELLASSFIELLRKKSVMMRAGAQSLHGLTGNIAIPRMTGAATAYWVAESGSPTESKQAFDQVAMSPKTLGAFTDISRKLLLQSSVDVEAMVRNDLATVIALEIDRAAFYGSGSSNQPTGIQNLSGIGSVDFAGNAPTFAEIIQMETEVAADNADIGALKYITNARGRGVLKSTEKASSTGMYIWEQGGTVNGYACEVSNQISQVAASKEHYWFGNWADVILGFWSGLDLMLDPYTGSTSGTVRIVGLQDVDVAGRHPESFCIGANLT